MSLNIKMTNGFRPAAWVIALGLTATLAPMSNGEQIKRPFVYASWQTYTTRDGLPDNRIRAIEVSGGRVWVGTENGLALYEDGQWRSWKEQDGLPWPMISAVAVSPRNGDVWLGTWGGGLVRYTGGRFDQFTQFNSGLAGDLVFAVAVDDTHVWAATTGGISSLDTTADTWELYMARRADAPETAVISLDFDAEYANLYAAAWYGGLYRLAIGDRKPPAVSSAAIEATFDSFRLPVPSEATSAVVVGGNSLWHATQTDVLRQGKSGLWESRRLPGTNTSSPFFGCLAVRHDGEAWLGGEGGLHCLADWDTDTWVTYRRCRKGGGGLATISRGSRAVDRRVLDSTIPADWVRCIAFRGDDVWVGTIDGLARGLGPNRWSGLRSVAAVDAAAESEALCEPVGDRLLTARPTDPELEGNGVDTVSVATFGPITRTITLPGADPQRRDVLPGPDTLAVQLAIEQFNALGGYRGQAPFALVFGTNGYRRYGWSMLEDDLALFAREPLQGILASLRSEGRMGSAAALFTGVPIVNVSPESPDASELANPWVFRCPGDDPLVQRRVLEYLAENVSAQRFGVLRTPGVLERRYLDLWCRFAAERNGGAGELVAEVADLSDDDALAAAFRALQESGADAILTWAGAETSARILRRMREAGMTQTFVGGEQIVCAEFIKLAGSSPGSVIAPYPCPHRNNLRALARFAETYTAQSSPTNLQRSPTLDAYLAYHAASHLLLAINIAGPERQALRETLAGLNEIAVAVLDRGRWKRVTLSQR